MPPTRRPAARKAGRLGAKKAPPGDAPPCSFCGRGRGEAGPLVEGPSGASICGECLASCRAALDRARQGPS